MTVRVTRWVLPLAFTVLATLVGGTSRARAADDVRPPTLVCVDGLLARHLGHPGERTPRRHRWLCDVDGQMNGVCAFGRRCHMCVRACPALASPMQIKGIRIQCHVTVPVPVGQQQQEGGVILACTSSSTPTSCGPELSCDTASEVCVVRQDGGPGVFYACEPVPAGCESDRSCRCAGAGLCPPPFRCADDGPNSITCGCPKLCA